MMTERPLSITTQIATPIQATLSSALPFSANDALPITESVDEEPYTIKCICDYSDDDGNTIYCETCDTWQHIECFYPGRVADASRADFDHSCTDCKPRSLDGRHATERQRHQRQNKSANENGDKKTKRPPSKSHKKKAKPSELQVNGVNDHDAHNGSPQDHHPPAKKTKGHRSSHSISASSKRSPPFSARPSTHNHPPSPAHTPSDLPNDFHFHTYSENFLRLYNDDEAVQKNLSTTNSFASLSITNSMSSWLRDSESLEKDIGIKDKDEVFQFLIPAVFQSLKLPQLKVERKDATVNDVLLSWRYLITPAALLNSNPIGELNGLVSFQKDYCEDTENKWTELAHPRPFVFFHPRLPLCLDTRHEGSICRYIRRSCRANATLDTFIASGSEYHFWLVSDRSLAANEQITLPWDFRFPLHLRSRYLHLLNLGDEDGSPSAGACISDAEYDQLTSIIDLVLSEHGGCACDLGNDCAFARFHRNYHGRSLLQTNGVKSKKGRESKQKHVSPTSTGHATNSRAASEGQLDTVDDDNRSTSGSSRSKPQSRDLTPLHSVGETNGSNLDVSDREKRKLAMLEDTFRKMEQGPPRKKKKAADGPTPTAATNLSTVQTSHKPRQRSIVPRVCQPATNGANSSRGRQYVDASTSRRQSGSPYSAVSPSAALPSPRSQAPRNVSAQSTRRVSTPSKVAYADSGTQTEDVEDAWWKQPKPRSKRKVVSLAARLLKNRHGIQAQQEMQVDPGVTIEDVVGQPSPVGTTGTDASNHGAQHSPASPTDSKGRKMSVASSTPSIDVSCGDVVMTDTPAILIGSVIKPPPPPWPGQSNNTNVRAPSPGQRSPDLRVQMPPTQPFSTPNMSGPLSGSVTPSSATGSLAQSPFGTAHFPGVFPSSTIGVGPSPIKTTKKLSLSDYKAARMRRNDSAANTNKANGGSSPTGTPVASKPSLSTIEEAKANGILDCSAISDTPLEKAVVLSATALTTDLSPENSTSSEKLNGTL
ncbi:hypothetical protein BJ875DRAFT_197678 [Amylocarpus encephaloides]|uniref:SET domain-containing protein n=1 Tax=Amylocarpus encephaloides TaxID=45428 RepID=A0A9P7Y999_9HELO|nr:hypothetical protein BJ875DRAFT_197678 [Amylocarpus encephaloides]